MPGPVGDGSQPDLGKEGSISSLVADFQRLEAESGGRLGVAVLATGTEGPTGYCADERFPMCSTFKLLAAAAVLKRVDGHMESLDRRIAFGAADIVVYSPVTKARVVDGGMSLGELCEACNGQMTRIDRVEPHLNEALPGGARDTTTPFAMSANLRLLVLGDALSEPSRKQLTDWLLGNKTGNTRLRTRLPQGWRVGDKTGAGERGTNNDVGLLWPPSRDPAIVSAYLTSTSAPAERRNATLAAVGESIAGALGP